MSLTDDWKAGKLKWHRAYYCQNKKGEIVVATLMGEDTLYSKELGGELNFGYWEVLAPCDYEELQQLKSENEELKHFDGKNVCAENEVLRLKNAELKELLRQCIPAAKHARDFGLAAMIESALADNKIQANPVADNIIQESEE